MASIFKVSSGWRAQVRLAGKPSSSKILPTQTEAKRWARDEEHRLQNSRSNNPDATFSELLATYLSHTTHMGKNKERVIRVVLAPYWGDYRMTEITSDAVARFAAKRKRDGVCPCTILGELSYLGVVLSHGGVLAGNREAQVARLELKATVSALRHTGAVGDSHERDRRPSEDELNRIISWSMAREGRMMPLHDIVLFAITTCMREGEIVALRVDDINLTERTIFVRARKDPRRKQGRNDVIPLVTGPIVVNGSTVDPCEIIKRQISRVGKTGRLFPYTADGVYKAFKRACLKSNIRDLTFHDLRHEGVSRLFESDYDIPKVASISGHRSWKHLQRYTHLRPSSIHHRNLVLT